MLELYDEKAGMCIYIMSECNRVIQVMYQRNVSINKTNYIYIYYIQIERGTWLSDMLTQWHRQHCWPFLWESTGHNVDYPTGESAFQDYDYFVTKLNK